MSMLRVRRSIAVLSLISLISAYALAGSLLDEIRRWDDGSFAGDTVSTPGLIELRAEVLVIPARAESRLYATATPRLLFSVATGPLAPTFRNLAPEASSDVGILNEPAVPEGFKPADIIWDPPATMTQGESVMTFAAALVSSPGTPANRVKEILEKTLESKRPVRYGRVPVGPVAIANVISDDPDAFKIVSRDDFGRKQPVVIDRALKWGWHLTPLKTGRQILRLFVYTPVHTDIEFPSRPETREVDVIESAVYQRGQFWRRNEQVIIGAIATALFGMIVVLLTKSYRARSKDSDTS